MMKTRVRVCVPARGALFHGAGLVAACLALSCGDQGTTTADGAPRSFAPSEDPVWIVGTVDGPDAEMFFRISGGKRLDDGSVVVGVEGTWEIRKFGADGTHLWTAGKRGVGPGEFVRLSLLRACSSDRIHVYDQELVRITEFNQQGERLSTWQLAHQGPPPYERVTCAPDGRIIYFPWGSFPAEPGIVRFQVPVVWTGKGERANVLRENVPGPERVLNGGYWDRPWTKRLVLGGTREGVWIGTSDDYVLELVSWDGSVIRTLEWTGDDLTATQEDIGQLRDELVQAMDEEERNRFLRDSWPGYEEVLPFRVPAYSRLMAMDDGSLWVGRWEGIGWGIRRLPGHPGQRWDIFDPSGKRVREVTVPANMSLLDGGDDWVLVVVRDELNVQRLAVYELRETG